MKKLIFLITFFIVLIQSINNNELKEPKDPDDPSIVFDADNFNNDDNDNKSKQEEKKEIKYNIKYVNKAGIFKKGIIDKLKGTYLKLTWDENESGSQEVLIDFVRSIRIKGYKLHKKKYNDTLSIVYYYPYVYDIKMNDGKLIKNARGRIPELDSFTIYNNIGKEKCYTYFIRYWLEDKSVYNDNKSGDFNENPVVPDQVIIYLEFIDDKSKSEE